MGGGGAKLNCRRTIIASCHWAVSPLRRKDTGWVCVGVIRAEWVDACETLGIFHVGESSVPFQSHPGLPSFREIVVRTIVFHFGCTIKNHDIDL
ncbi:hypothetical protein AG1IA_09948 [Rhizoctonia solani AG-1 IA]|uniref:Uncharacterized protein n=1 Tax=Thanatephorus cucumeris (strain AG1-IA) TaxID=983506 RepID=L8WH14_THACA|nr:hypothetical protein AG1IA_09948 [Rhizoctonia solani AG-1 IA]